MNIWDIFRLPAALADCIFFALLMLTAVRLQRGISEDGEDVTLKGFFRGYLKIGVVGVFTVIVTVFLVGLSAYFAGGRNIWEGWVSFSICAVMTVALLVWNIYYFEEWRFFDVLVFFGQALILFLISRAAILLATADIFGGMNTFISKIPFLLLIVVMAIKLCFWLCACEARGEKGCKALRAIVIVIAIILAILLWLVPTVQAFGGDATADTTDATVTTTSSSSDDGGDDGKRAEESVDEEEWLFYYNLYLQNDGIEGNEYNFGPNPYEEGKTAADYDAELRFRMRWDTKLYAGDSAYLDAKTGTRYMGEFYESCKGDWAKTINLAGETLAANQTVYYQNLDAFFAFLDSAESVTVEYASGLTDQMYMNPYTVSGVPDVIVMETTEHEGWFLVYTFNIKGNKVRVSYRIDCGYQPTNVAEIMDITPQPQPVPTDNPTPTDTPRPTDTPAPRPTDTPTPTPTDAPTPEPTVTPTPEPTVTPTPEPTVTPTPGPTVTPTPTPTPTPTVKPKDPSEAPDENTEPDDDSGSGPDTNNGEGANNSTADQPQNSDHEQSHEDYRDDMEEAARPQNTGGGSNTPSYTPSEPSQQQDSNAASGNGGAPVDQEVPVNPTATEAGSGQQVDTSPTEEWGADGDGEMWQPQ